MLSLQECLENIKNAVLGRDVRQSIHDGIKGIDDESKADMEAKQTAIDEYTKRQDGVISDYTGKMDLLNSKYEEQIKNMTLESPSDAEIVDARRGEDETVYDTLKERLDTEFSEKASIVDPIFTGSFSMGRKEGSNIGIASHAEGGGTIASASNSHAEGGLTTASGHYSHAEGLNTIASGEYSHAEGYWTEAKGDHSHAEGCNTIAGEGQHACGYNNVEVPVGGPGATNGTAYVIGNGYDNEKSNCFRITYNGNIYSASGSVITGADYAEYFEWKDGNQNGEDRVGYFVTFDTENKIKKASENDYILGITSGNPCLIGNGDECWSGKRIMDEFNRFVYEDVEYTDVETGEKKKTKFYKINPDYDETMEYTQRMDRKEWDTVGMLGVIPVRDDGTCEVNGYCKVKDGGIATRCDIFGANSYRVISRVSKNVVNVVFR